MEEPEELLVGGYKIIQDVSRCRFTSDSVLLARFLKAKKGERVADFCAGSGIVGLHFYAENGGTEHVTLFEMQEELAAMSGRTVALNGLGEKFTVENCRVQDIPAKYNGAFSLILCNPPYRRDGTESPAAEREICRRETALSLGELCQAAARCLKHGGRFALIHRADRLCDVFCALRACRLEPKKLRLVAGKAGAKPYAALICAVKGGKCGLEVLPALPVTVSS